MWVNSLLILKKTGLDENTLIIFTSDNGTHAEGGRTKNDVKLFNSSGSFRGIKRDLYEGGIRVPLIINWKNTIKQGTINNHEAAFWDLLPTLCEFAGVKTILSTDGISMLPSLKGLTQSKHEFLFCEFYQGGFKQAVRMNQWKAIRFFKGTMPVRTELYDLSVDRS